MNEKMKPYFGQIPDSLIYLLSSDAFRVYAHIRRRMNAKKQDGTAWDIHRGEIATSLGLSLSKAQDALKMLQFYKLVGKTGKPGAESYIVIDETYDQYLHTCPKGLEMKGREVKERPHQKGEKRNKPKGNQFEIQTGTSLNYKHPTSLESKHNSISDESIAEKSRSDHESGSEKSASIQEPKALPPSNQFDSLFDELFPSSVQAPQGSGPLIDSTAPVGDPPSPRFPKG